jgi:hypothetical protein
LGDFANLATPTAVDRNVVAQLTEANSRLAKQLEDNATSLKEVNALLKKERAERASGGNSERPPRRSLTLYVRRTYCEKTVPYVRQDEDVLRQWGKNSYRDSKQLANGPTKQTINKRHDVPEDYRRHPRRRQPKRQPVSPERLP